MIQGDGIMNKENKKLAQMRRKQEREKELRAGKAKRFLPAATAILVLAVIAAAVLFIRLRNRQAEGTGSATGTQTGTEYGAGMSEDSSAELTESSGGTDTAAGSGTKADQSRIVKFDPAVMKDAYDISKDELTYVQIKVKGYGTITAALDAAAAPVTVKNFVTLVRDGFYNGLTFHRIMDGFMIQGGDPLGNGTGGSDKTIKGEFSDNGVENPISHVRGALFMARSQDPDSASSQFFIVQSDSDFLDGQYAGFGYVTEGMDIVDKICKDARPTDSNGTIASDEQPVIESITVAG